MATVISPTKANLTAAKKSLALAKNGYDLLDKKRNILVRETMAFADEAAAIQSKIDEAFQKAYEALRLANVTLGTTAELAEAVPVEKNLTLHTRSVMGAEIPLVSLPDQPVHNPYGFYFSNSYLDEAFFEFQRIKHLIARLAQIENSVYRLATAIGKTQKRANALKNIVIPRYEDQIDHINEVLEEKDLEEHARMKMIKAKKA